MKIDIWDLLNWLDGTLRPVEGPKFGYRVGRDDSGELRFEVRGLKVWIYQNRGDWIAQGLDIGFAASGKNAEEARERFMRGLFATIDENLRRFGSLDHLVRPAEADCWIAWRKAVRHTNRYDGEQCDGQDRNLFGGSVLDPSFYHAAA